MEFFGKMQFDMAKNRCADLLKKLAADLQPLGTKEKFTQAVSSYDVDTINRLLNEATAKYCGTSYAREGLIKYCQKFGIQVNANTLSDAELICLIADHKAQISDVLTKAGL